MTGGNESTFALGSWLARKPDRKDRQQRALTVVVSMLVVDVRIVRMAMCQRRMGVLMRVWLAPVPIEIMHVLVMLVVHVAVCMRHRLVGMQVLVAFGQVQPHAGAHQCCRQPEHG